MKINDVEYVFSPLTEPQLAQWREKINQLWYDYSDPYGKFYARIRHLPQHITEAMMRECMKQEHKPTSQEFNAVSRTRTAIAYLSSLSCGIDMSKVVTEQNKNEIAEHIGQVNKVMTAQELTEYLAEQRKLCQISSVEEESPVAADGSM